ncbi:MAG: AAA family ATPase [Leptolyngbyaceae cyanobacterium]
MKLTASLPQTAFPTISGYTLVEQLYVGSRTAVYRAVQNADQRSVVIKVLQHEHPSFGELVQFRNQYTIAKDLPIPGIIQPLSLASLENGYALVMEDWQALSLAKYCQQHSLTLTEVLEITLQMAAILHDLGQHRVVHKDIKPANILIRPESQQIKLIDFSIASSLPKETQAIQNPNILEGTLAYLAPEQTGRMNRGIDYRADFYALGVTLYQLLTGTLPFISDDPLELLHGHLAKQPLPVDQVRPEVPAPVAAIVAKLMAKNAEDRYQSALGLQHDVQHCLTQWQTTGTIAAFELGQRDLSDRFLIPEKLYGREAEVKTLLEAFDRVADGAAELMLVAGFSGIGKTAVVNEVHKPIVRQRGYFIKGKFDQFNRNIPLSAFVPALQDLMEQLLSESDEQLQRWKTRILAVVGENGQVLIEVMPTLEQIIGPQPPAPELAGSAAQHRFNSLFQQFIEVFTTQEHPLVLFLDDLQWADAASLQLMQLLMNDNGYLLILGAYRDNEVSPVHPLMMAVQALEKAAIIVNTITLAPLEDDDINHLVADTLNCATALAQPLTQLVNRKTQGNPFFTTQFLKALHEDGQMTFNCDRCHWECDIAQVNALALTDDVVEFMAVQLQRLPAETQQVLKLAACIGNQFDLHTLVVVSEQASADVAGALWKALQEGLIVPTSQVYKFFQSNEQPEGENAVNPAYRFLHDRIQQAAYSLIPDDQKQATHYQIGQLLRRGLADEVLGGHIFDLLSQLNAGAGKITNSIEKQALANLNLKGALKAKGSTSYAAALKYCDAGIQLLADDGWETDYQLTLQLHELATESAYLYGENQVFEQYAAVVLEHAGSDLDQLNVNIIKIQAYTAQNRLIEALKVAKAALKKYTVVFPAEISLEDIQQELQETQAKFSQFTPEEIVALPKMTDTQSLAVMRLLLSVTATAYIADQTLFPLIILKMVQWSLKYGNAPSSPYAYACYGILLVNLAKEIETVSQVGELALTLLNESSEPEIEARTKLVVGSHLYHWNFHFQESIPLIQESYHAALAIGDLEYAGYSAQVICLGSYFTGQSLMQLEPHVQAYCHVLAQLNQVTALRYCQLYWQVILNLRHPNDAPSLLVGEAFDEQAVVPQLATANDWAGLYHFYCNKLILNYLFGNISHALAAAEQARPCEASLAGMFIVPTFYFYESLAILSSHEDLRPQQPPTHSQRISHNRAALKSWAQSSPGNHQHRFDLVEAEYHRVVGRKADALELYDRAIAGARANDYLQEEALANELAARFYLAWGKDKIAQDYLTHAYYGYAQWGATAKVKALEQRYPNLLAPMVHPQQPSVSTTETVFAADAFDSALATDTQSSTSGSTSISAALDLTTVLRASQVLSSEIQLDKLLATLLRIVLETAGADKGALLMPREQQWFVEAVATIEQSTQVQSVALSQSVAVPHALINTVKHGLEPVVIMDAAAHSALASDAYVTQHQPKSLLCIPILQQGKLIAILYLENQLTVGAFTRDRVELLNVLCTQASISLENARLYTQAQEDQRRLANLMSNLPGMAYLAGNDEHWTMYFASEGCFELTGYTSDELINNRVTDFGSMIHADDIAATGLEVETAIAAQRPYRVVYRIRTKQGQEKWLWEQGQAILDDSGNPTLLEGLIIDISDRKAAEAAVVQKSQALSETLSQLQSTQLQMVQGEKMATLGNLVAGVAHEINNPIGFLNGSIRNAEDYIQDLFEHLQTYQALQPPNDAVQASAAEVDLEFLLDDLPKLLNSMQGATERIKSISTGLRTFSRADTEYKVRANLHEGLDSTLLILKYRLKANELRPEIQVTCNYGELPAINCFPGQLNQVFMNILANAIDIFDEMAQSTNFADLEGNPQKIVIQSQLTEQNAIEIRISDNGKGMTEAVKDRIFDHLFTTKGVGQGTGLGLAISRQIVAEKHKGTLTVKSALDQGTEFCIRLPL